MGGQRGWRRVPVNGGRGVRPRDGDDPAEDDGTVETGKVVTGARGADTALRAVRPSVRPRPGSGGQAG